MKNYTLFCLFVFSTIIASAQSTTFLPDVFELPKLSSQPACTEAEKGRMYYDVNKNQILFCNGTIWNTPSSQWANITGTKDIYFTDKVGIGTATPAYTLDVNGTVAIKSNLTVGAGINIGGETAYGGLNIFDMPININDTKNNTVWNIKADSNSNSLQILETVANRMTLSSGGSLGIGTVTPSAKLDVKGDANFLGNIKVNAGKGIVQNASGSAQMKIYIGQLNVLSPLTIYANNYATTGVVIPLGIFDDIPAVSLGQLLSTPTPFGEIGKLTMSISAVTVTNITVRFYNPTANPIQIKGAWKLILVGE